MRNLNMPGGGIIASVLVPAGLVLIAVALAAIVGDVAPHYFLRDLATTAGVHPLTGAVSMLGMVVWSAAAAVSLLTVLFLKRRGRAGAGFFLASAALSGWLLFDDLFLFHDVLAPAYLKISTEIVLSGIGLAVLIWLAVFRREILKAGPFFLVLALGFFGLSIAVDLASDYLSQTEALGQWRIFCEDGAKWLGIACWLAFHVMASLGALDQDAD